MNIAILFKKILYIGNIIPALIGFSVFFGYVIQSELLKSFSFESVAMNPATAIVFIFCSISLFLANREKTNPMLFHTGLMCAVLIALAGFIKLGGILTAQDIYIDSHLFIEQLNTEALTTGHVNSMAPTAAINFFFTGISLFLLYKSKKEWLAQLLSLVTFFIAFLTILGYLYDVKSLTGFTSYIPMAVNTAIAFTTLSLAVLFLRPTRGLMSTITSENAGGILIRKLIPATILVPTLLGYLGLVAEQAGIFTNELGLSLIIIANIIVFTAFIWWIATILNNMAVKLKASYATLEQKVQVRTQDLEKFKQAIENITEMVVITDRKGTVLYANPAIESTTGFNLKEVIGTKAGKLWGGQMEKSFYEKMWKTISIDKKTFIGELVNKRKNGENYTVNLIISPILSESGKILFYVAVERDITKEKEIDMAKTEFVSLASHQLRTPLTIISWCVEMLLKGDFGEITPDQEKYLGRIYQGSERMIEMVNALLNISRIEKEAFITEPTQTDIIVLARSAIDEQKPEIEKKKLIVLESFSKDTLISLTDPKLLRMVFQNLLSNAVEYTPEGGKIEFTISLDKKKTVLVKVSDTGCGIPKNQQHQIFTKFFRVDNVKKKDTDGTGLGLYIVKSVVEKIGGKVWFESPAPVEGYGAARENPGTTFYVALPLDGAKAPPQE